MINNLESRARWLRHHCKLVNHFELDTARGKLDVRIYDDHGKAVRVSSKDDQVIDISLTAQSLIRPFNPDWQDIKFGGF